MQPIAGIQKFKNLSALICQGSVSNLAYSECIIAKCYSLKCWFEFAFPQFAYTDACDNIAK